MKQFFLFLIALYQIFLSPIIKYLFGISNRCRFPETCSEYAKRNIKTYGVRGIKLSATRLLSCQTVFNL